MIKPQNRKKQQDLIDYIAMQVGCTYISDMHEKHYWRSIKNIIRNIKTDRYSLMEWNDLAEYLFKSNLKYTTGEEARNDVIGKL